MIYLDKFVIFSWHVFKIFLMPIHLYQVYRNNVRIREAQYMEIHYIGAPPQPRSGLELTTYEIHSLSSERPPF